jgi:hypothetical protein
MTPSQARRLRQWRSRVLVRAWDYRQRRHARGVWYRLRRALADAAEVYAIPRAEAERLVAEGHSVAPVGQALDPPKLLVLAPRERLARVGSARRLEVGLSAELLASECLALVPFAAAPKG